MTIDHIRKLREQVEAGASGDSIAPDLIYAALGDSMIAGHSVRTLASYILSPYDIRAMGAAKALHEAVLPDGSTWSYYSDDRHCIVSYGKGPMDYAEHHDQNPARAWLIAILKALEAKDGE